MVPTASRCANERWLRAFAYGLLAEVATVAAIVATVMAHRHLIRPGRSEAYYGGFSARAGFIVGAFGGAAFVFLFARLVMRHVNAHRISHGMTVAAGAIALSIAGSLAGHGTVPASYLLASALKLVAGAVAGYASSRALVESGYEKGAEHSAGAGVAD